MTGHLQQRKSSINACEKRTVDDGFVYLPYVAAGLEQLLANGTLDPGEIIDSSHGDCGSLCLCLL